MPWKKGQSGNPNGSKKGSGAGRKPDSFKAACEQALKECRGVEFMRDVAKGKEFFQLATGEGEVLPLPPSLRDRQKAVEWLADRAFGKPTQTVEGEMNVASRLVFVFPEDEK